VEICRAGVWHYERSVLYNTIVVYKSAENRLWYIIRRVDAWLATKEGKADYPAGENLPQASEALHRLFPVHVTGQHILHQL
jgi:hypothetical protein